MLGDKKTIDGVKPIVVDKLGDMTNKDCFAYQRRQMLLFERIIL